MPPTGESNSSGFTIPAIWKWIAGTIGVGLIATLPWTFPLLRATHTILTEEDEIEFERSKRNSDIQIDYQRALHDQVLEEVQTKSWWQRRWFNLRVLWRMFELSVLFAPTVFMSVWALVIPPLRPLWWQVIHHSLDFAGGCWIKLGQWSTTRPDIFPSKMLSIFDRLQDNCTPHSFEETRQIIRENYHAELEELFDEFSPTPLAVGAIAQVYKAKLKLTGQEVAVKVLHPHIKGSIQIDLAIMSLCADLISFIPGSEWMGIQDAVKQFGSTMIAQVDMTFEARNLMRFAQNFSGDPNIVFPRVVDRMSTKQVLVETFEYGQPLAGYLKNAEDKKERKVLAHIGLRAYLTMLLVHNFIHADMHPGNLMVRKNSKSNKMQIVLLDVGLICELSDIDWLHFKQLFRCIVQGDGKAGARLMVEHARQTKISDEEREAFTIEMDKLFTQLRINKISDIDIGLFLTQMLDVVRTYKVRIDTNFTTLVVGTVLLEGIGRQLDSDINILDQSVPFLIWSDKANMQDRLIFIREKLRDEFERPDTVDVPLSTKIKRVFKPLTDSVEPLSFKL